EPVEIGDVTIPAGAQVIVCLASANRDADHYPSPDALDIDRAEERHLAFGHGIHHCLGALLARMEGQLALGSVLRRFPQLRLAVTAETGISPEIGGDRPDLTAGDFKADFTSGAARAVEAFSAEGAMDKPMKLPYGELPGSVFMVIAATDTFTHGWDMATATGQS